MSINPLKPFRPKAQILAVRLSEENLAEVKEWATGHGLTVREYLGEKDVFTVSGRWGSDGIANMGDWLITEGDGFTVMSDWDFREQYEEGEDR